MKLLITGGCGFLGSNLAAQAIRNGYDVCVFDNLSRVGSELNLAWLKTLGKVRHIHGDIRSNNDVERVIKDFKPNSIFHLAGQVAMTTSIANPRLDFEVNVLGSFNVLESVLRHSPETAIIYSSTNKVYGDLEQYSYLELATRYQCQDFPNGFNENINLAFSSPYGVSKGSADQYMLDYATTFGLKTVVFRHSSMYGGRQFATYDQGWIGWFCGKALETQLNQNQEIFSISGNGKQVRDVLHADDMVNLYFETLRKIDLAKGQAFNIGGGVDNSLSLIELFDYLEQTLDVKLKYSKNPVRQSDQKVFIADLNKITTMIGWQPNVSYKAGINKMLQWLSNK